MPSKNLNASSQIAEIYDALPPESQRVLIHKHLLPLLDNNNNDTNSPSKSQKSKSESKEILAASKALLASHNGMPHLDLKAKQIEIKGLLDLIERVGKRAFVEGPGDGGSRSAVREVVVSEMLDSLVDWLNDIWSVVFEYKCNFELAHSCLLFIADTLNAISLADGGECKCPYTNNYISLTISTLKPKPNSFSWRKQIKRFDLDGAHRIDRVLLWIWRDLFSSLLFREGDGKEAKVKAMLEDVERILGWRALQRVFHGGKLGDWDEWDDDEDDDEDEDEEEDTEDELDESYKFSCFGDEDEWSSDPGLGSDSENSDSDITLFEPSHWPPALKVKPLLHIIHGMLFERFKTLPSLALYNAIAALPSLNDLDDNEDENELEAIEAVLEEIDPSSGPDAYVGALEIHVELANYEAIDALVGRAKSHIFRPSDFPVLQAAIQTLSLSPYPTRYTHCLEVIERELIGTLEQIKREVIKVFAGLDDPVNRADLKAIARLNMGSETRKNRVERYVDSVQSSRTNAIPPPMAFAAMMMGLPPSFDPDDSSMLDELADDPDLQELRDEKRPKMDERFAGWWSVGKEVKGGRQILEKIWREVDGKGTGSLSCVGLKDVVDEMIDRVSDYPSKRYIRDALIVLASFYKSLKRPAPKRKSTSKSASTDPSAPLLLQPPVIPSVPLSSGLDDVD